MITLILALQRSVGLPDVHSGYGFAIGNMAAFNMGDPKAVVSPGKYVSVCLSVVCNVHYVSEVQWVFVVKQSVYHTPTTGSIECCLYPPQSANCGHHLHNNVITL